MVRRHDIRWQFIGTFYLVHSLQVAQVQADGVCTQARGRSPLDLGKRVRPSMVRVGRLRSQGVPFNDDPRVRNSLRFLVWNVLVNYRRARFAHEKPRP